MSDDTFSDSPFGKGTLRYDLWVEEALREVIKKTLAHAAQHGLPGDHHFYISFLTQENGVVLPGRLRAQHPHDMTIVLQYQFEDLVADADSFSVTLSFGGIKERLTIPYTAIISFADPSVNFALQLKMPLLDDDEDDASNESASQMLLQPDKSPNVHDDAGDDEASAEDEPKTGEVITLDAFRKK